MGTTIVFRYEGFIFEWDANKAHSNLRKHHVAFEEAAEVFVDPLGRVEDAFVGGEERLKLIGYSRAEHLLLVVHVERGPRIRIISARRATEQERNAYESS